MPVYDFDGCGCGKFEELVKSDVYQIPCPSCGQLCDRQISMPAKTASQWGDTQFGINGKFNRGLGVHITSRKQEDDILKKRGLIREADLGTHFYADQTQKQKNERDRIDKISKDYHNAVVAHGDDPERHIKAATEIFPAKQMLEEAHQHEVKGSLDTTLPPTGI